MTEDIFKLENNISEFLHRQLKRGNSLTLKRKEVPSSIITGKKSSRGWMMRHQIDIENPICVNLEKVKVNVRRQEQSKRQEQWMALSRKK